MKMITIYLYFLQIVKHFNLVKKNMNVANLLIVILIIIL